MIASADEKESLNGKGRLILSSRPFLCFAIFYVIDICQKITTA